MKTTPLNVLAEGTRLVAQMIEFPAGGAPAPRIAFARTAALVYVLEGKLQLDAGGMQEVLEAGDCAFMESEMTLAWSAAGKHRCRILAVAAWGGGGGGDRDGSGVSQVSERAGTEVS